MGGSGTGLAVEVQPLRVLIIEDSEEDVDLLILELRRGGFLPAYKRVDTPQALATCSIDARSCSLVFWRS